MCRQCGGFRGAQFDMPSSVTVTTGSRLHFGPLSYGNLTGPRFGGIGVMLDSPGYRVEARRAEADEFIAPPGIADVVKRLIKARRQRPARPVRIAIPRTIPRHQGFGSGTQLALGISQCLHVLETGRASSAEKLAAESGRGRRSAIGIHGFEHGGFLFDAGKETDESIGRLERRIDYPCDWRFVLVTPPGETGMRGKKEQAAFRKLPAMPASTSQRLRSLAGEVILPAVESAEFETFGAALFEFGATVGDFFAPVQGGRFAHLLAMEIVDICRRLGFAGVAQSSWGPTLAVVAASQSDAAGLAAELQSREAFRDCEVRITAARNRPARVDIDQ